MSSRIQSASVVAGTPIMSNSPQVYLRADSLFANPDVDGFDVGPAAADAAGQVANLAGYRGAVVTIFHAPSTGNDDRATEFRLKHGDTDSYAAHNYVDPDDLDWKIVKPGTTLPSTAETGVLTILVDAARVKQYISVEAVLFEGSTIYHACVITPIGPIAATKNNVDQAGNLFVTASGDQSFPDLDPT